MRGRTETDVEQNSYTDYRVGIDQPGTYKTVLNSDRPEFGGWSRIDESVRFFTTPFEWNGRGNFTQVYLPARTVIVLARE